jgi:hypothetical protein
VVYLPGGRVGRDLDDDLATRHLHLAEARYECRGLRLDAENVWNRPRRDPSLWASEPHAHPSPPVLPDSVLLQILARRAAHRWSAPWHEAKCVDEIGGGITVVRLLGKTLGRESGKKKKGDRADLNQTLAMSTRHAS